MKRGKDRKEKESKREGGKCPVTERETGKVRLKSWSDSVYIASIRYFDC